MARLLEDVVVTKDHINLPHPPETLIIALRFTANPYPISGFFDSQSGNSLDDPPFSSAGADGSCLSTTLGHVKVDSSESENSAVQRNVSATNIFEPVDKLTSGPRKEELPSFNQCLRRIWAGK